MIEPMAGEPPPMNGDEANRWQKGCVSQQWRRLEL